MFPVRSTRPAYARLRYKLRARTLMPCRAPSAHTPSPEHSDLNIDHFLLGGFRASNLLRVFSALFHRTRSIDI